MRKALPRVSESSTRRWAKCGPEEYWFPTHVTAAVWDVAPDGGKSQPLYPSCALSLDLRQKLLRAALVPRLSRRHACATATKARQPNLLTIHLRGGDTVPAKT